MGWIAGVHIIYLWDELQGCIFLLFGLFAQLAMQSDFTAPCINALPPDKIFIIFIDILYTLLTKLYGLKQCFGSDSFWCGFRSADPLPEIRIRTNYIFFWIFFCKRSKTHNNVFFCNLWVYYSSILNKISDFLKKKKNILMDWLIFIWVYHDYFFATRIRFNVSGSGSVSGSETLV